MINFFYKDYLDKQTVTFSIINMILLITKLTVNPIKPMLKQKRGYLAKNGANK